MALRVADRALRALNRIPNVDSVEIEELWLLCITSSPVVPAQLMSFLPEAPNVTTCCTGHAGRFPDLIAQVISNVQDIDAMYVVREDMFPKLSHCMPVSLRNPVMRMQVTMMGRGTRRVDS